MTRLLILLLGSLASAQDTPICKMLANPERVECLNSAGMVVAIPQRAIERDAKGKIVRHRKPLADFRKLHPCPATGKTTGPCPGWVMDHVWPLCARGDDAVPNLQWQSKAISRPKDKEEMRICRQLKKWQEEQPENLRTPK